MDGDIFFVCGVIIFAIAMAGLNALFDHFELFAIKVRVHKGKVYPMCHSRKCKDCRCYIPNKVGFL
jgi:hypothetical protein